MVERGAAARRQGEHRGVDRRRRPAAPGAPAGIPIGATRSSPRVPLAGRDPLAELGGVEADGEVGLDRRARDLAAGGVDAGGDVAGDDRRAAAVDRLDRRRGRLARRAGEAGAEDRVDDRARAGQPGVEVAGVDRAPPPSRSRLAAASPLSSYGRPEQQRLDLEAHLRAEPRRDQAVAAVVALAADDPHRPLRARARATASAPARPAASISSSEATPCSSIAQRVDGPHPLGVVEAARSQGSIGPGA